MIIYINAYIVNYIINKQMRLKSNYTIDINKSDDKR